MVSATESRETRSHPSSADAASDGIAGAWRDISLDAVLRLRDRGLLAQIEAYDLRSYIQGEAANHGCICLVEGKWEDGEIDLLFVVEGDLYDGESAVLPIVHRLQCTFPSIAFDVMVLPASSHDPHSRWGTASEVFYRRQQATT
ncbi:MAG: hypothetical protein MUP14_02325 [Dehalococcoidia bacterium]|nr:hypothetical protein [Dehalococcoidia bacterium]